MGRRAKEPNDVPEQIKKAIVPMERTRPAITDETLLAYAVTILGTVPTSRVLILHRTTNLAELMLSRLHFMISQENMVKGLYPHLRLNPKYSTKSFLSSLSDSQHEELGPTPNIYSCGYASVDSLYSMRFDAIILCFKSKTIAEQSVIDNQVFPTLVRNGILVYKKVID